MHVKRDRGMTGALSIMMALAALILTTMTAGPAGATSVIADAGQDQAVMSGDNVTLDGHATADDATVVTWEWTIVSYQGNVQYDLIRYQERSIWFDAGDNGTVYQCTLRALTDAGVSDTDTCMVYVGDFGGGRLTPGEGDDDGMAVPDVSELCVCNTTTMILLAVGVLVAVFLYARYGGRRK